MTSPLADSEVIGDVDLPRVPVTETQPLQLHLLNRRRHQGNTQRGSNGTKTSRIAGRRVRRTVELMTNPMSIALMVLWVIACVGALSLNILADVFQSEAPAFPLVPTIATGVGLNAFCALFSALLGRWALRGFRLYQPFVGGQAFVVMQGFGYGILVISSVVFFVYLETMRATPGTYRYGTPTVLGCFGAIANITLMVSLLFFVPKRQRRRHSSGSISGLDSPVWWHDLSASPNGEIGLVVCFCVVMLVCSTVAEYYPHSRRICAVSGCVFLVLSTFTIHAVIGYRYTPGYRLFMPDAGSFRMSLLQAFGWFLASASLQFNIILYKAGEGSPPSWHLLVGLTSVISLSTLLLFVRMHRFPSWKQSETSLLAEYGPLTLSVMGYIHVGIVWGVALLLSSERFKIEFKLRQGLIMCQTLSSLLIFALPPCTHLLGRIAFGGEYEVWSPFKGPLEFVVLQSAGWTCYGAAIFFATLQITEHHHFRFVIIQSSLLALAQGFVHASLHLFEDDCKNSYASRKRMSLSGSGTAEDASTSQLNATFDEEDEASMREEGRSLISAVLNGEMLTAILLSISGLFVRIVADVAVESRNELDDFLHIPTDSLLKLASCISFLVMPLAHGSMRNRISIVTPFVGCGGYVAMQSIGWSLYAVNIFIAMANTLLGKRKSLLTPLTDDQYVFLEYTMEGLFATIPLVCIIMGAFFETNAQNSKKNYQERRRQEVVELFRVLQRAIPEEDDLRHAEALLKTIAGPRWQEPPATDGARLIREDEETARLRQEAAQYIVMILSGAGALAFLSAAFLAERQPVFTLVFGVAGLALTTISCFSVHYVYGSFLHRASGRYSFFMPFSGGPTFVTLQAIGWGFYAASALFIVMSCAEGRGSAIIFVSAGVFSVSAQYCILNSVPRFDPTPRSLSFLERHAEGIVAILSVIASFAFAMVYEMYEQGRISGTASSLPALTLSAVCTCFAVPLGLVSLQRQSGKLGTSPFSLFDMTVNVDESDEDIFSMDDDGNGSADATDGAYSASSPRTPMTSPRQQTSLRPSPALRPSSPRRCPPELTPLGHDFRTDTTTSLSSEGTPLHRRTGRPPLSTYCMLAAAMVALLSTLLLPFVFVYMVYCYLYSGLRAMNVVSKMFHMILFGFGSAVLVPMFAMSKGHRKRKSLFRRIQITFRCYVIYSIPTIIVVGGLSTPFFIGGTGGWTFSVTMVLLSCISTIPYIQQLTVLGNVCILGYLLHHHLYICLLDQRAPFAPWELITDTFLTTFWVWYYRRCVGRPHITGRLYSRRAQEFFRRVFFECIGEYFNVRLVVDGRSLDTAEEKNSAESGDCVDMKNPANQYMFSFHPHGVFPCTAMWLVNVLQWERLVGWNNTNRVTVHSADVTFSVPLLRDVVMCLGGLSVARRCIENSLSQGNSPLVVTGGQAEMMLTKISDTEMHLVSHHSGFIRLALRCRVPVVPIICFAEHNVWGNVSLPRIQNYTIKKLGFPFPTLPYGRWYLPIPTNRPLLIAVGRPIYPQKGKDSEECAEHVEEFRKVYFKHLAALFLKYRAQAGYPKMSLFLHNHNDVTRID